VRAVAHAKAQLMHLALPDPSVRWKRHESAMDSAMNTSWAVECKCDYLMAAKFDNYLA